MKIHDKTPFVNNKKEAEKNKGFKGEIKTRSDKAFVGGTAYFNPEGTIVQKKFDLIGFLGVTCKHPSKHSVVCIVRKVLSY